MTTGLTTYGGPAYQKAVDWHRYADATAKFCNLGATSGDVHRTNIFRSADAPRGYEEGVWGG